MKKQFNVLQYKTGKVEYYDVLPYLRSCWREKRKYARIKREKVKSKEDLKEWIRGESSYMFRARCQYEFLLANWPFGNKQMFDDLKVWLPVYNIGDWEHDIKFCNIIMRSMEKIDIYDQIMMNIDAITDILYIEFKLDKKYDKRRVAKESSGDDRH
jgi:hypothetical protein